MRPFNRVLIANRGEIAIRIAKAAAALGVESVAVSAPADEFALHSRTTTSVQHIAGGGPTGNAVGAYLDIDVVIAAAIAAGCDCVHPGYGFLSESAEFARRCAQGGLTFIGPPPDAVALFGDKVRSRELARSLGIPVVPGSTDALTSSDAALELAGSIGFPVMLKASAGGGGRGMRAVERAADLPEAFERCRGEAEAAFGNGALFLERLVVRPRHIEVQILADAHGGVIHLFERDCSVQLRNQKVVEIAPAPGLDPTLRAQLHDHAVALVRAAGYVNAGTVEFLVVPETGEYFFIECNPRIQVEHTITEQVMGVDLVEAQFRIAAGATLESLGLGSPEAVGLPRGYSVQARVVATGVGTFSAYKEPTGVGVRVDASGYLGYAPPPQFDPLFAKVIGTVGNGSTLASALDRTARALDDFHVAGVPTNISMLRGLLTHPAVQAGDSRTTLIAETTDLGNVVAATSAAIALFERQSPAASAAPSVSEVEQLPVAEGHVAVVCPLTCTVVERRVSPGDTVGEGDVMVVVNAMKMETLITASCSGIVTLVIGLNPGDDLVTGQIVAVISPVAGAVGTTTPVPVKAEDTWTPLLDDVATLQLLAADRFAPGSLDPGVVRQRNRGKLTCRERIDALLDEGTFREVGSVAGFASYGDDGRIAAFTPANHVGGWGKVDGRTAIVCADDFTSRGGHADGAIGAKSLHLDRLSVEMRIPSIRLLDGSSGGGSVAAMVPEQRSEGESAAKESSGAITAGRPRVSGGGGSFLPGHLGSTLYTEQLSVVPVVNVLLGSVVGIGAAKAVLGHFSVMVRDVAQLFVAGPPVVRHAMGYDVTKEDLGGWHIHCRNGSVDNLAETEAEALSMTKRFLSYLPGSVFEAPPVEAPNPTDPASRRDDQLLTLVPRKRTTTFDIRRAIAHVADVGSFFEVGALWGTDQVTGFIRCDGHPLGVIASDSRHVNGGALTADGCDKVRRMLDLCDLFHIPILNLVDNPGFAVGIEHEIAGTIRKGGEWMVAFAQVTVPIFTVIVRRSFGVAGNNWATPKAEPSVRVTWPSADVGGIPPEGGIEAAYKRQLVEAADPVALRAELEARIESVRGPLGPLSRFQIEEMIDPRDTRPLLAEWVETAYRLVSQPTRLTSRPLGFRP